MSRVKIETSDGKVFVIDAEIARMSHLITKMLELTESDDEPVQLPKVSSRIMEKIIAWAEHHKDDLTFRGGRDVEFLRTRPLPLWDEAFLEVDRPVLFELVMAANFLDIKLLVLFACKKLANLIQSQRSSFVQTFVGDLCK